MTNRLRLWPLIVSPCLLLVACDWVDSTGNQGFVPQTEVFLDDAPVGGSIAILENTEARITASRDTTTVSEQDYIWSDAPLEQGNLAVCAAQDGFKPDLAAPVLSEACTDPQACSLNFEPVETSDGVAEFILRAPQLKASIGMRYDLSVEDVTGLVNKREFTFCFIAINEAPVARDDTFVVREGIREVFDDRDDNLLSNDEDDIDVSDNELSIVTEPVVAPSFAAELTLEADGSFIYESSLEDILTDQFDSFEYAVTDGELTSTAKVTLRIVARNQSPVLTDDIPLLEATEGELFTEDLAAYFSDPESVDLTFSLDDDDELPSEGTLRLSAAGVLSGIPDDDDVGTHAFTLIVSDGGREIEALVTLNIEAAPVIPQNSAPEYVEDTVFDQIILLGRFIRPVAPEFEDDDGDDLTYEIVGRSQLPTGVTIDEDTGIVSGRPAARTWVRDLRIEATDPFGESAISEPFYIRVR